MTEDTMTGSMNAVQKSPAPVEQAFLRLGNNIEDLEAELKRLAMKIGPALGPDVEVDLLKSPSDDVKARSSLVEHIDNETLRIRSLTFIVSNLINRVEL